MESKSYSCSTSLLLGAFLLYLCVAVHSQSTTECLKIMSTGDFGTTDFGANLKTWFNAQAGPNTLNCASSASAVLLLGDNFYEFGVWSTSDSKWDEIYENQFNGENIRHIPHFAIAGNHDHYALVGLGPQTSYKNSHPNSNWEFPSKYYTKTVTQNNVKIFFVFIDTWDLVGGDSEISFGRLLSGFEKGRSEEEIAHLRQRFLPPLDEESEAPIRKRHLQSIVDTTQKNWIETQLASTAAQTADWLVVVGHYPVRTSAEKHGETNALVSELEPMMKQYKVDAYIGGHDHISQIVDRQDGTPVYYLNGAGAKRDEDVVPDYTGLKFSIENAYAFFSHVFTKTEMTTRIHYKHPTTGQETIVTYTHKQNGVTASPVAPPPGSTATPTTPPVVTGCEKYTCGAQCHYHKKDQDCVWSSTSMRCMTERFKFTLPNEYSMGTGCVDCKAISCGRDCYAAREFGCAWSSNQIFPKFKGPGGKGTCVRDFGGETTEAEMDDGVCSNNANSIGNSLQKSPDTTSTVVGGAIGGLVAAGLLAVGAVVVIRRRRSFAQNAANRQSIAASSSQLSTSNPMFSSNLKVAAEGPLA